MDPSRALLRRYLTEPDHSEDAFRELVERHVNLVYQTARRHCGGDEALARDAAQMVFTDLAQRALRLPPTVVLAGWLYRHTGFVSAKLLRSEKRRRQREHTAYMQNHSLNTDAPGADPAADAALWQRLEPVLDEALGRLSSTDRDALVLRFLEGRALREVGGMLGLSENTARMRVSRALEKLRVLLHRRGVTSTAMGLDGALGLAALSQAPGGFSKTLAAAALQSLPTAAGVAAAAGVGGGLGAALTSLPWWGKAAAVLGLGTAVALPVKMLAFPGGGSGADSLTLAAGELSDSGRTPAGPQGRAASDPAGSRSDGSAGSDESVLPAAPPPASDPAPTSGPPAGPAAAPEPATSGEAGDSPAAPTAKLQLGVLPGVMQFDKKTLTVKPGQKVMLLFQNAKCPLQHNFLLLQPGSLNAVGALADKMLADPGAAGKAYIPSSPDILAHSSKLIGTGQTDLIQFTAPATPGDYPYLCTFPGHWRLMNGVLKVVP